MDLLFYVFACAVGIAATLATIAIWAPRQTRIRVIAIIVTALFIPVVYIQTLEMLSKPKPTSFEWYQRARAEATVLGVSLDEGKAIYLWLRPEGSTEPRYYVVPWSVRLAEKLEEAVEDAVRTNSTVVLKNPFFKRSFEEWGDLNVTIVPPALPRMKLPSSPPPRVFNPREPAI